MKLAPASLMLLSVPAAFGQSAEPLKLGDLTFSGSLLSRVESSDWFSGSANNDYTFSNSIFRISLSESTRLFDWQLELAGPFLLGLPDDAIAKSSQDSAATVSQPTIATGIPVWSWPNKDSSCSRISEALNQSLKVGGSLSMGPKLLPVTAHWPLPSETASHTG